MPKKKNLANKILLPSSIPISFMQRELGQKEISKKRVGKS